MDGEEDPDIAKTELPNLPTFPKSPKLNVFIKGL